MALKSAWTVTGAKNAEDSGRGPDGKNKQEKCNPKGGEKNESPKGKKKEKKHRIA